MSPTLLLFSTLLFFVTTSQPLSSFATSAEPENDPVLDINGDKIQTDTDYYILPVIRGQGGGLTLAGRNKSSSCPLGVVQDQFEASKGLPVTFSPVDIKKGTVRVSTDVNIKFSAVTICTQSTVWRLDAYDVSTKQWFISIGGVEGNPGKETTGNWFKIDEYENDYKLRFCPNVCKFCKVICRDIGVYVEDGIRRLALSDVPFRVRFKKAWDVSCNRVEIRIIVLWLMSEKGC